MISFFMKLSLYFIDLILMSFMRKYWENDELEETEGEKSQIDIKLS